MNPRPLPLPLLIALAGCAGLAGCQTASERAASDARAEAAATLLADGRSYGDGAVLAGEARRCITPASLTSTRVLSDRVIDFESLGRRYRNVLPRDCPRLGSEQRIAYEVRGGQLCQPELIRVLDPGARLSAGPGCSLGPFQPIDPPPRRR